MGAAAALLVPGVALLGCSSSSDDPTDSLARRVRELLVTDGAGPVIERLDQLGVGVDQASLDAASVSCPQVPDPSAGDSATCRMAVDGPDGELEVDVIVEFEDGDGIRLTRVEVAP